MEEVYKCKKCNSYSRDWYLDEEKREHWKCYICGDDEVTISEDDVEWLLTKIKKDKESL